MKRFALLGVVLLVVGCNQSTGGRQGSFGQ